MSFTPTEWLALDTNEYIFAVRRDEKYPASRTLLFEHTEQLRLYIPGQVWRELERNLTASEM